MSEDPDLAGIAGQLAALGWITRVAGDVLEASRAAIAAQWLLGSRRVDHRLRLECNRPARTLTLAERSTESTRGLPPPFFSRSTETQVGLDVSAERHDGGIGGGSLHYGAVRPMLEQVCARIGWRLELAVFKD